MNKLDVSTTIKMYTPKQLSKVEVPSFQRWIVNSNKNELKTSVHEVGLLRCPIICHVRNESKDYIIDGNHLKQVIVESFSGKSKIPCIYKEVDNYAEAALVFILMNTKGKKLDLVDYTHLYMHTSQNDTPNIYKEIWSILGNPSDSSQVKKYKMFSIPTIVEIIAGDKNRYKNGQAKVESKYSEAYIEKVTFMHWLLAHASEYFEKELSVKGYKMPTGAAMISFIRMWLGKNGFSKKFTIDKFIEIITSIYKKYSKDIIDGKMVINRDNGGKILLSEMKTQFKALA